MRYFLSVESTQKEEARKFLAAGVSAFACAWLLPLLFFQWEGWFFLLELFACVLLFAGCVLWDKRRLKKSAWMFAGAFFYRIWLLFRGSTGIFGFLWMTPFSLLVLIGTLCVLWKLRESFSMIVCERHLSDLDRAALALPRAELSFWVARILAYLSDLLLFPAILMLLWAIGIRLWTSYLIFRKPLKASASFRKNRRLQIQ